MNQPQAKTAISESERAKPGRLSATRRLVRSYCARIPFSIALAVTLIVTSLITGTFFGLASDATQQTWAAGVTTTFEAGRWWTILAALVIPFDPFQLVAGVLASLTLLGIAEHKMGTGRTILAFFVTGIIGVSVGVFLQWIGSLAGEWWAQGTSLDLTLDPLTGIIGALITSTIFMGPLWRRRIRIVTIALVAIFVLYDGDSSNVYRMVAIVAGLGLSAFIGGDRRVFRKQRSSHAETRSLVAAIILVTALGPIVALINASELTPFAYGSYLFADDPVDANEVFSQCGQVAASTAECLRKFALVSGQGVGMFMISFLPSALLVLAAWGLRAGRRFAWWLALAVNASILIFARTSIDVSVSVDTELEGWSAFDFGELIVWVLAAAAMPIVTMLILVKFRRDFSIHAPQQAVVRFVAIISLAFVVLASVYLVSGLATLKHYVPAATFGDVLFDTFKRFIPPHFIGATDPVVVPAHELATIAFQVVGPLFWIIFIAASVPLMRANDSRAKATDGLRIRRLLKKGGGGTLGFMTTWPGNVYWFSADGEAAVAYRVINGVAITMSDPVCDDDRAEQTLNEFAAFCDARNWVPVFYSFHEKYLPYFNDMGWLSMSVGEETVVRTEGLQLTGKAWQKVRSGYNKGVKAGMTTVWASWDELPLATTTAIKAISESWVSEKELPEMGFTLGGMEELKDPDVRLMLAVDPDERIQAITSWLPSYRDGVVTGWTIDFMRRADDSMSGIMEFVIASAALKMADEGIEVLSLSGAPLASKPLAPGEEAPEPTVMTRVLELLAKTLEPAYGFSSLFRFKAKFNPEYHTIYMAYPDALALPAIGIAIGRAYLPDASGKETLALMRTLTK